MVLKGRFYWGAFAKNSLIRNLESVICNFFIMGMWGKRIGLFLLTNIAIMVVLTTFTWVFGIDTRYLKDTGLDLKALAIFSFLIGMAGAFISLFISKWMAKWMTKAKIIKTPQNDIEAFLVNTIKQFADTANLGMPEVAIYPSPEINAFATGWNRNKSLVAVSQGLLDAMERDEIEGVLAHEMGHIRNGDMVTMALLQGLINTFVIFGARVAAYGVMKALNRGEEMGGLVYYVIAILFEIIFAFLASIIVMRYSRWREFGADYGGAQLAGKQKMIAALKFLQSHHDQIDTSQKALATMKISDKERIFRLFSSHPPLEKRIEALEKAQIS